MPLALDTPLAYVKGVGPARAAMLSAKGLEIVEDLLNYFPFRYEDRSNLKPIARLAPGEMATVIAEVRSAKLSGFRRRNLGLFEAGFSDASGATLLGKWFHGAYLADRLTPGTRVALFGKIEFDSYRGELQMMHPEIEFLSGDDEEGDLALHVGRIVPVYEAAGKVSTRILRVLLHRILQEIPPLEDRLPEAIAGRLRFPSRTDAIREAHFPSAGTPIRILNDFRSAAQFRLIFEEFFWLECGLEIKRQRARAMPGIEFALNDRVREQIKKLLPFKPTGAQKRVLKEIADDMARPSPMNRLLQGDVGSGKTIVAAEAALIALENGYQVAILAPTEILAAQHYFSLRPLLQKVGYPIALLTGSSSAREKGKLKEMLRDGLLPVAVGTHALIEKDVEFAKLGLVVIDEQHRFGVMQRFHLVRKGVTPDVLVMTATPIPRTLAMTLYGDLDVSVIDELPPGRQKIVTKHFTADQVELAYSAIRREIDEGRQAYVVYPVIEESETQALGGAERNSMKAAQQMYEHLSAEVFPDVPIGLLHGRLGSGEKEAAMDAFKSGRTRILVSTTVIEVGVDVPNATVMVVEQAERFGLSQLHQLRGRVGRGHAQSYCLLITEKMNDTAKERIRTLVDSQDGFAIAEMDLKLRGPGEFFGTKQSGLPSLRIANILRDPDILGAARNEARAFVEQPPSQEALLAAIDYIRNHWQRRYGLVQVG
ncbi:MAG TPA: ATP-dependent DNA helicase RecG [Bryobacteraceae bacterium]|nr:ATP-dependent DNA helicase RecG [Bryobacteraceae bacterium]